MRWRLTALALTLLPPVATAQSTKDNLLPNPGFEDVEPCVYQPGTDCPSQYDVYVSSSGAELATVRRDANRMLRMIVGGDRLAPSRAHVRWTTHKLQPGTTYEFSVAVRTLNLTGATLLRAYAEPEPNSVNNDPSPPAVAEARGPGGTSVWTRLRTRLKVPEEAVRVTFELTTHAPLGTCQGVTCGRAYFDDVSLTAVPPEAPPLTHALSNPCNDHEFLDPFRNTCLPRTTQRGFDRSAFEAAVPDHLFEVSECSEAAVRHSIDAADQAGGGTVRLPACRLVLTAPLYVPDQVLLEGAGIGNTILTALPGHTKELVYVNRSTNVTVRDLTLDGNRSSHSPLTIYFSDNALVERVELVRALRNGMNFSHSTRVTVRYSTSHETQIHNGISSKDCFPTPGEVKTSAQCEAEARLRAGGKLGPGSLWTQNYAVYSNHVFGNAGDHGLALHALEGEVAGNWVDANRRGMKLPDAWNVNVHHNRFTNNILWGLHIYPPVIDHYPRHIIVYANRFEHNGDFPIRIEGARSVFLLDNVYVRNNMCYESCWNIGTGTNALRIQDLNYDNGTALLPTVFVCDGTEDARLPVFSYLPVLAKPDVCRAVTEKQPLGKVLTANDGAANDQAIDIRAVPSGTLLLEPNFPNPCTETTRIPYVLPAPTHVRLDVLDALGRRVETLVDRLEAAGRHTVRFTATPHATGTYLLRLQTPDGVLTRSFVVMR